jgi:hypothetical protein
MKINMGSIDRIVRIMMVQLIIIIYTLHLVARPWANVLVGVAILFVVTSITGYCPILRYFETNTLTKRDRANEKQ